ncbi:MAG TPA: hypothetical protein VGS06_44145 [Streptosporangiaceae bacterium]|nr:hypothetical protein [Streptosporangiaceae bacterium]
MTNADDGVSEYLIYIGYGEVMRRFQVLELGLWGLLTRKIKPGTNLGQAMEMVARWDGTTFGQLMRGMKNQEHWPEGLVAKLMEAVEIRNYLAHHFLREFFMAAPSQENLHDASSQLADLSVWLDELDAELDAHLASLGIETASSIDAEAMALADSLRPEKWFGFVARERSPVMAPDNTLDGQELTETAGPEIFQDSKDTQNRT